MSRKNDTATGKHGEIAHRRRGRNEERCGSIPSPFFYRGHSDDGRDRCGDRRLAVYGVGSPERRGRMSGNET